MVIDLTDESRWEILHAPADESAGTIARRLHLSQPAVYAFRRNVMRQGWVCALVPISCQRCGGTWYTSVRRKTGRLCRPCRLETAPKPRRVKGPEARRLAAIERSGRRYRIMAAAGAGHDRKRGQPWSEDDQRYLLEHRGELRTPEGVARLTQRLGRSYGACISQLSILRRQKRS